MSIVGWTLGGDYDPAAAELLGVSSYCPSGDLTVVRPQDYDGTTDVMWASDFQTGTGVAFQSSSGTLITEHNAGLYEDFSDHTFVTYLVGGDYGDVLIGGASGDDSLLGGAGDDLLRPGDGAAVIVGGGGQNTLSFEGASQGVAFSMALEGSDQETAVGKIVASGITHLAGSEWNDSLTGSSVGDTIEGGAGQDKLTGGGGADVLVSLGDGDTLNGGTGADTYVFTSLLGKRAADIDNLNGDTIDVSAVDADVNTPGDQEFIQVSHFDGHAGEMQIKWNAHKERTYLRFDTNGDGHADHLITIVSGNDFSHIVY
jgi:Ca2+-binding RTX toxin-like protein